MFPLIRLKVPRSLACRLQRSLCSPAQGFIQIDATVQVEHADPSRLTLLVPRSHTVHDMLQDVASHLGVSSRLLSAHLPSTAAPLLPPSLVLSAPEFTAPVSVLIRSKPRVGVSAVVARRVAYNFLVGQWRAVVKSVRVAQHVQSRHKIPMDVFQATGASLRQRIRPGSDFDEFLEDVLGIDRATFEPFNNKDMPEEWHALPLEDRFEAVVTPSLIAEAIVHHINLDPVAQAQIKSFRELLALTDMREPHTWFPEARRMARLVTLHIGPTNSGKTHNALQALSRATSGVYCGPLRLLAWEVHDKLNNQQRVPCDLVTGHEVVRMGGRARVPEPGEDGMYTAPRSGSSVAEQANHNEHDEASSGEEGEEGEEGGSESEARAKKRAPVELHNLKRLPVTDLLRHCEELGIATASSGKRLRSKRLRRLLRRHAATASVSGRDPADEDLDDPDDLDGFDHGDDGEEGEAAAHTACTVEMACVTKPVEVGVVDEVQMMSDDKRGQAFTRAVLGLPARHLHLCGAPSVVPLVRALCEKTGDSLQIVEYSRLSPLRVVPSLDMKWHRIRTGDCLIVFSRKQIYEVKHSVELSSKGKLRCAVVYGSLPPEVRKQQAVGFNSGELDVLVASDAVGMGLNLQIKRVVFMTMSKFDGVARRPLAHAEVQQIAGRAGRFQSAFASGEVTCWEPEDMGLLRAALEQDVHGPVADKAFVFPSPAQLHTFCHAHGQLALHHIVERFCELAEVSATYAVANVDDMVRVAALLAREEFDVSLFHKILFSISPVDVDDEFVQTHFLRLVAQFANSRHDEDGESHVPLGITSLLQQYSRLPPNRLRRAQKDLESVHKLACLYVWLARRLPNQFPEGKKARKAMKDSSTLILRVLRSSASEALSLARKRSR